MNASAHCRISRVRFKDGPELTILENPTDKRREQCRRELMAAVDEAGSFDGWALVIWGADGSVAALNVDRSPLHGLMAAEFVKQRLLASRILGWAEQDTLAYLGYDGDAS